MFVVHAKYRVECLATTTSANQDPGIVVI